MATGTVVLAAFGNDSATPALPRTTSTALSLATSQPPGAGAEIPPPSSTKGAGKPTIDDRLPKVTGAGAVLTPPTSPTVKTAAASDCMALVDAGFRGRCGLVRSASGTAIWVTEARPKGTGPDEIRALLWVERGNGQWSLALRAAGTGTSYDQVTARPADLARDGSPKIVYAFRGLDDLVPDVDVVEASGTVVLHQHLNSGAAAEAPEGGIDTWSRQAPGVYRHVRIQYLVSGWRVTRDEQVEAAAVPLSGPNRGAAF